MQAHEHAAGSTAEFLPHGFCYLWDPQLLWTHVGADFLIGVSYVTISLALAWLVHRVRRDIPFSWTFVAFGLFIITCGMTHFMEIWTLWQPVYWLSGGVKVVTAVASVATAIAMPFTVPQAVATVRDVKLARERELAEARAAALEEQNAELRVQTVELEEQRYAAEEMAASVEDANAALQTALQEADDARRAAERADQAKSVFLRTMSHELRTPLNAIIGFGQLLETGVSGDVNATQLDQLQRIRRSADHLLGLIDEVLTLTRASAAAPQRGPVSLPDLIADAAMMVMQQASMKGLQLQISDIPQITVHTDARALRQILLNLLTNAIKFTATGTVTVRAGMAQHELLLHVTDAGVGIAAEDLERLFEPFWQAEQGTTRAHGGSGLGLSVSRELARSLGGTVEVQSEPGRGSTFTVRIPLAPGED